MTPPLDSRRKRPSTVVEDIWSELRTRILQGALAPGARLVELEIAAQEGASQASVREALQRLERDGLVVRRGRTGTFVTDVASEDMRDIFQIRCTVESLAARRAARSVGAAQLDELRGLIDQMRVAGQRGDARALVGHDMAFHQLVCSWAGQPTLLRVWTLLHTQIERFLIFYDPLHFRDLTQVADSHLPILEALAAGDEQAAAERMERHIRYVMTATDAQGEGGAETG